MDTDTDMGLVPGEAVDPGEAARRLGLEGAPWADVGAAFALSPRMTGTLVAGAPAGMARGALAPDPDTAPADIAALPARARRLARRRGARTAADLRALASAGASGARGVGAGTLAALASAGEASPPPPAAASAMRAAWEASGALLHPADAAALGEAAAAAAGLALVRSALYSMPFGGTVPDVAARSGVPAPAPALRELAAAGLAREESGTWAATGADVAPALAEGLGPARAAVLAAWLSGATLEEAGAAAGVTRERARQVARDACSPERALATSAARWAGLFSRYAVARADWEVALGMPPRDWLVLNQAVVRRMPAAARAARLPFDELASDPACPPAVAARVAGREDRAAAARVDGREVRLRRRDLFVAACRRAAGEAPAPLADVLAAYRETVSGLGLDPGSPRFRISARYADSLAAARPGRLPLLFPGKGRLRYWDPAEMGADALLAGLDVSAYEGREVSAARVFADNGELCRAHGITCPEELHNALRRLGEAGMDVPARAGGRMPMLEVGECDRAAQVRALADEVRPATVAALARAYEAAYGVPAAVFQSGTGAYAAAAAGWFRDNGACRRGGGGPRKDEEKEEGDGRDGG